MDESILKVLATPGVLAIGLIMLEIRLSRIESALFTIGTGFGLHMPVKKQTKLKLPLALLCFCVLLATGCAMTRESAVSTTTSTNGLQTVTATHATAFTFWDASNSLDKLRVSNGKTQSIGVTGQNETSSATNVVELADRVRAIATLLGSP